MKVYKVPSRDEKKDESKGYTWHLTKTEAKKAFKENNANEAVGDEIEELEFSMNKWDVVQFLNIHCSHPDNG